MENTTLKNVIIKNAKGKNLLLFDDDFEFYHEQDIYCEDMVEDFSDNDEITSAEEGFMVGYLAA
jgi:hypothetical protein